jgi:hypothetical protein
MHVTIATCMAFQERLLEFELLSGESPGHFVRTSKSPLFISILIVQSEE